MSIYVQSLSVQYSYGDMAFNDFIHSVLATGDQLFAAHMVIMSSRPSIKLNSRHATSVYVTISFACYEYDILTF